jgi:signal peptidase I
MNFPLIMFLLLVLTGGIWALDALVLRRGRAARHAGGVGPDDTVPEPWWVEYSKSFFPVILVVFLLRSFLVEPFKIPSGSMLPTLLVGDFILVNKYTYGIRLPVINVKVMDVNVPQRGEVMVFRYPVDPSLDYIKRVVGLPGDEVAYRGRRLTINGREVPVKRAGDFNYVENIRFVSTERYIEKLDGHEHAILIKPDEGPFPVSGVRMFPYRDHCAYNDEGFVCKVPPAHYFMMGDNRDGSDDSRYWGFVPEANIVGKAFLIWWNFDDFKRIGSAIE